MPIHYLLATGSHPATAESNSYDRDSSPSTLCMAAQHTTSHSGTAVSQQHVYHRGAAFHFLLLLHIHPVKQEKGTSNVALFLLW